MFLVIRKESLIIIKSNGMFFNCGKYLYVYLFYVFFCSLQIFSICSKSPQVSLYWKAVIKYGWSIILTPNIQGKAKLTKQKQKKQISRYTMAFEFNNSGTPLISWSLYLPWILLSNSLYNHALKTHKVYFMREHRSFSRKHSVSEHQIKGPQC